VSTSAEQDQYVNNVLDKYKVPAPNPQIKQQLETLVRKWVGPHLLSMDYSGSFAKLTAVRGQSDMDFFISMTTTTPLQDIYQGLFDLLNSSRLNPRKQNVSVHINYLGAEVDLTPGRLHLG
jgi:tRNA nucleotidyltransferase (CCA-adding enzyme)